MNDRPSITIVLPAYNEADTIEQAIGEVDGALSELCDDYEILVVDDGSTDGTADLVRSAALRQPRVRLVSHGGNRGYGAALRTGFDAARCDLVGFTDADCQLDPRELDRLLFLSPKYAAVCGYRIDRKDPPRRRFLAWGYNLMVRALFGVAVRDCDCALKLFRREVLQGLDLGSDGFFINAEILAKLRQRGERVVEVGVSHRPRAGGSSTVSLAAILPSLTALLRFWWSWALFPRWAAAAPPERRRVVAFAVAFCLLALPLLFLGLDHPLIDPDETRYNEIPTTMVASGDYVVPYLAGKPYLDKPPLLYWATAASLRAFGAGPRAARLPVAVAALLTALLVYAPGRRLVGDRAAALGSLLLLLTVGFLGSAHILTMDGLLTLFTTAGLLASAVAVGQERYRPGWWLLAGLAYGLGFLTKGPVILALCLPPLLASRWLTASPVRLPLRRWLLLAAPAVAVALPWFVVISRRQPEFLRYFFWQHNVVRYTNAFNHAEPWWYFIPVFALIALPGSALLPSLAGFVFNRAPELRRLRSRECGFLLLATVWVVGFFSLSSAKIASYIVPALPPAALLVGLLLRHALWPSERHPALLRVERRVGWNVAFGALLAFGGLVGLDILVDGQGATRGHAFGWSLVALLGVLVPAALALRRRATRKWWIAAAALSWASVFVLFADLFPEAISLRQLPVKARETVAEMGEPGMPIVAVGRRLGPGSLYMRGDEIEDFAPGDLEGLARLGARHPRLLLIADRELSEHVRRSLPGSRVEEVGDGGHLFLVRLEAAGAPGPPPEPGDGARSEG